VIELAVARLEAEERLRPEGSGRGPRYIWVDAFCASQNLLNGAYLPTNARERAKLKTADPKAYAAQTEDISSIFVDALNAVDEIILHLSPLTQEWRAPRQPFLLSERGAPPKDWQRKGPQALSRAWCILEVAKCLEKECALHVVLNPAETSQLDATLEERFDDIAQVITAFDARDAQVSHTDDQVHCRAAAAAAGWS
jgi:hypothetical protein